MIKRPNCFWGNTRGVRIFLTRPSNAAGKKVSTDSKVSQQLHHVHYQMKDSTVLYHCVIFVEATGPSRLLCFLTMCTARVLGCGEVGCTVYYVSLSLRLKQWNLTLITSYYVTVNDKDFFGFLSRNAFPIFPMGSVCVCVFVCACVCAFMRKEDTPSRDD